VAKREQRGTGYIKETQEKSERAFISWGGTKTAKPINLDAVRREAGGHSAAKKRSFTRCGHRDVQKGAIVIGRGRAQGRDSRSSTKTTGPTEGNKVGKKRGWKGAGGSAGQETKKKKRGTEKRGVSYRKVRVYTSVQYLRPGGFCYRGGKILHDVSKTGGKTSPLKGGDTQFHDWLAATL